MRIRLELVHKNAKVKKVVLKADTLVGRSAECGLRIASNEVSRQHCKICLSEDAVTVRDLGSSNGTFVNGYQLEEQTDYEIAPDSELSIGGIKFMVRFEEPPVQVMQSDGFGSTVDLKPGLQPLPDEIPPEPEQAPDAALQDTSQFGSEKEETKAMEADSTDDAGETVERRIDELDSARDDDEVELEAYGDSAILERDNESSEPEPAQDAVFPGLEPEPDVEQDSSLGEFFQKFE